MSADLLTLPIIARRLRVPAKWLAQEADAGRIPCLRAGRRLLFNEDVVRGQLLERATELCGKPDGFADDGGSHSEHGHRGQ